MLKNKVKTFSGQKAGVIPDVSVNLASQNTIYKIAEGRGRCLVTHNPKKWELTEDGEWLPVISTPVIMDGVNGVSIRKGREDLSRLLDFYRRKGIVYINDLDKRLGKWVGLICAKKNIYDQAGNPTEFYYLGRDITKLVPSQQSDGTVLIKPVVDREKYNEFRRHLIQSGIIEDISIDVLEKKLEILTQTLDTMSSNANTASGKKTREDLAKSIAMISAQLEEINSPLDEASEEESVESVELEDYSNIDASVFLQDEAAEPVDLTPPTQIKKGKTK